MIEIRNALAWGATVVALSLTDTAKADDNVSKPAAACLERSQLTARLFPVDAGSA